MYIYIYIYMYYVHICISLIYYDLPRYISRLAIRILVNCRQILLALDEEEVMAESTGPIQQRKFDTVIRWYVVMLICIYKYLRYKENCRNVRWYLHVHMYIVSSRDRRDTHTTILERSLLQKDLILLNVGPKLDICPTAYVLVYCGKLWCVYCILH